ncbi:MAG: energy transducer TonB [Prevotella sp.]|nr:energy transducer TonB [Prevotella sp.]
MKRILLCLMMATLMTLSAEAQTDKVYDRVEVMPEFPGGMQGLFEYMQNNVNYPKEAKNQKIEGRVIVSFIVEKDGSISEVHPLTAVHPLLDKEAIRLVNEMPRWKPGTEKGKAVRVSFALPVSFKL